MSDEGHTEEEIILRVDDRGRIMIPKEVREQLGIEPGTDISAQLQGSMLTVDPKPSTQVQTVTAGRDNWESTTPTDAGESLFGPMDHERTR